MDTPIKESGQVNLNWKLAQPDHPLVVSQIDVNGSTMTVKGNAIKGADLASTGKK